MQRSRVEATVTFGQGSYRTDEDVRFTLKLKNIGETRAVGLTVFQNILEPTDLVVPYDPGWGPLKGKPGLTLDPGATYELPVSGKVRDLEKATAVVRGVVFDETGFGAGTFNSEVAVTKGAGHAAGVVFGDRNGNGVLDGGEQLAGVKLTLRYVHSGSTYTATSDGDGKFAFDAPAADYYLGGEVTGGWLIPFETVHIGPDTKDLLVRGAPPLNGALKASMAFTQRSYKPGELAHVTVTLSNSGPIPLTGIAAACNRIGDGYMLNGRGPGWGDLAAGGVTIAPGQTRTFDVSETVPEAAFNRGYVAVACDFGYREVDIDNHAKAEDRAAVPGAKATVVGDVAVNFDNQGRPQQGVAGVKVVLVSDQDCPVAGEQTTDANGHFEFHDVVPGPAYQLYFLPPQGWRIKYGNPTAINVYGPADHPAQVMIQAEPGDAPLPAVPAQPASCGKSGTPTSPDAAPAGNQGPGGGQGSGSGLASTGVDALTFGTLGLLTLTLGAFLLLSARRRRRPTS
ncbi:SdrD B-like domain-containing protein [Amycolatopsis sp. NPDC059021]|uniref:SdrD B-like domain-containing protein n=1 Tax=Amycolatopsis sp. NPDC059021 TaxID=3346704 RepID=UPI00366DA90A